MTLIDLEPAAARLAGLLRRVPDELLAGPTPCPAYTLGDLIEHVGGLALAFTAAARKSGGAMASAAPAGDASRLPGDWRTRIPSDLLTLAEAWRAPDAWTGMTRVGGVDLPGQAAGLTGLDEIVVHGWDVAVASGQAYPGDEPSLTALYNFLTDFVGPDRPVAARDGIFGPAVDVPENAPLIDRVVGLTGRDPGWTARLTP